MANRYNRRSSEKGDVVTNATGIVGVAFSAAKAVGKLAAYDPTGLLDGAAAIGKSSSLVKEEMKRNQKYRERIERTEKCQRKYDAISFIVLAVIAFVLFWVNNSFCNHYLSWMFLTATITVIIQCIGILYDSKDYLILGGILTGCVLIISIALAIGNNIAGDAFPEVVKKSVLLFLFCSFGIVIGLIINRIAAEAADKKY